MTVAFTRLIINQTDPLSLTFFRYGAGALVLLIILLATQRLPRIARRDLIVFFFLGVVMFAAFPYFMARALEDTTVARGALLFAAMPMITMIMGAFFKIEKLTALKTLSVVVGLTGTAIALGESVDQIAPNALRGDVLMFAGMICASSFNVFSKNYFLRYGTLPVLVYTMFIGVAALFILALIFGAPFSGSLSFDLQGWFIVFMLAVPGGAVMMYAWGRALRLITPTQAAITVGLNPVTAIALGAWLLSEPVTVNIMIGFGLIVAAILLANYKPRQKQEKT